MRAPAIALPALAAALAAPQPAQAESPATSCEPQDLAALAGWNGVWAAEGFDAVSQGISGISGGAVTPKLLGIDAPWNDAGWARMAAMIKIVAAGNYKNAGWGFPMMMNSYSELEFVIAPARTIIIGQYRDIRTVYTDGRGHVPEEDRWPTNWGDSVGCWHGDTLTIDTVGVRFDPEFNADAPPLSEQAHFVERLRLVAPGRIEEEVTITDPQYLTAPWTVRIAFIPAGIDRMALDAFHDRNTDSLTITPPTEEFTTPPLPANVPLSSAALDRVAGVYAMEGAPFNFIFEPRGNRLYFAIPSQLPVFIPVIATGPLDFETVIGKLHFVADASSRVTGFEGTQANGAPLNGKRIEAEPTAAELDSFAGRYAGEDGLGEVTVEQRDGRLYASVPGATNGFVPLYPNGPRSFINLDGAVLRFVVDDAGKVTGVEGIPPGSSEAHKARRIGS